ncbi:MAG: hypothetical protein HKP30_13495, partial [Myxococcales bacterium]|nr:hypothetical protein [Myxococcales bacterium]
MVERILESTRPPRRPDRSAPAQGWNDDLQSLLGQAVARLSQATGCPRVAVFSRRADGEPYILAATPEAAGPHDACATLLDGVLARSATSGRSAWDLG